jgi:hypothetical protein
MRNKKGEGSRPRVTCLMQASIDGKIMIARWPDTSADGNPAITGLFETDPSR